MEARPGPRPTPAAVDSCVNAILDAIADGGIESGTKVSDLTRDFAGEREAIRQALTLLEEHGFLQVRAYSMGNRGRPAERVLLVDDAGAVQLPASVPRSVPRSAPNKKAPGPGHANGKVSRPPVERVVQVVGGDDVSPQLRADLRAAQRMMRRCLDFLIDDKNITFQAMGARDALLVDLQRELRGT